MSFIPGERLHYAETHFKFRLPWSLLFRPWPEILVDAPFQFVPGAEPTLWIAVRDAHRFPTLLEEIEIQIKARSSEVTDGDAALFSAITHDLTENFYFVFYSERLDMMWILSSAEFLNECVTNKTGKNKGKRSIWFNGNRKDKQTGIKKEYCKEQFEQYIAKDFSRFH